MYQNVGNVFILLENILAYYIRRIDRDRSLFKIIFIYIWNGNWL